MPPFAFDIKYRESDEYKALVASILAREPELPEFLVDAAVMIHKTMPNCAKGKRKNEPVNITQPRPKDLVIDDAITVLKVAENAANDPAMEENATIE